MKLTIENVEAAKELRSNFITWDKVDEVLKSEFEKHPWNDAIDIIAYKVELVDKLYNCNLGGSKDLRENAEKRKANKQKSEPRRTYDVMDFLNFIDYSHIISQKKNWTQIFQKLFREKFVIQAPFERISNIRNDLAHNRFEKEDFEKCKTYIDDIIKYIPD